MPFELIASTPPGFPDCQTIEAAWLAGFEGCLNLEYRSAPEAVSVLNTLVRHGACFSVSLCGLEFDARTLLEPYIGRGLQRVILTDARAHTLTRDLTYLREKGVPSLVTVTSVEEAQSATALGAEGVVAKGNECGGRVGEETVFILLQRILPKCSIPVFAQGGVGLHTVAACLAAGASGVLLDWQLSLCDESQVPLDIQSRIQRMDGSETAILGQDCDLRYRAYARPGERAFFELRDEAERAIPNASGVDAALSEWEASVVRNARQRKLLLIGQDGAFAAPLAQEYGTVGGVLKALRRAAFHKCRTAARLNVLREGGPLAQSNGTRFPILQGPMTRVSDRANFALAVAEGGGLPFLALALMRGPEVAALVAETKQKLGALPWGIGVLGFVPKDLRDEQLAAAMQYRPPFALIAGGRPDQAKSLEEAGTHTYLHVPSPELLRSFLENGARKVIFEGRECGGHVGPRTSFVLWEQAVRVILSHLSGAGSGTRPEDYHIVFAGGIHDALSAAMVSALSAALAERGVRVGVLLGTSYLFTEEAVRSAAITEAFQEEAISCGRTLLLESGVGHATRCSDTAFGRFFNEEKRRLIAEGRSKDEIRDALEGLNLGRLRIAAKGILRLERDGKPAYENAGKETQRLEGMFMIGQVAAMRDGVCSIEALHRDVGAAGEMLGRTLLASKPDIRVCDSDIAIVGMSCVFPKAKNVARFWQNILEKLNAIQEVPKDRWDSSLYFDADRRARDKIYSQWGGFLEDITFDPLKYGMPPNSMPSIEPLQLITLEMVREALADSGYLDRRFDREKTSVVVGTGGGVGELGLGYGFRSMIPHYLNEAGVDQAQADQLIGDLSHALPEWTEDSFAGLLLNVAAGRVANRFDFGGTNYIVDAACATSLAALRLATTELESRASDVVVVAGADTMQTPFGYLCFSKTQALSPTGECRTFDETADGIVISEGVAVAILKRVADAERDGDKIYAVIRAVGASSDGKDKGLTAPRPIGQIRALERAYSKAGFSAATLGLVEAHGTGTVVGDRTEMESLSTFLQAEGAERQSCALGSVKSMIGHTKCTAGFAGLVKAALALHNKVLPATIGVSKPNAKANAESSPFYINTETRPWLARLDGAPRRAGVSAFGFGGTNFHAVLEEYRDPYNADPGYAAIRDWPAELFLWRSDSAEAMQSALSLVLRGLQAGSEARLCDLAAAVYREYARSEGVHRVAIVAASREDLRSKIDVAEAALRSGKDLRDPRGVYLTSSAVAEGQVAFLFPGQGSQRVNMLRDLALAFPTVRETFEQADRSLGRQLGKALSQYIYPPPVFTDQDRDANEAALRQTNVAQPALGAADMAVCRLLASFGIHPDSACGHSYGEFAALCAAGAMPFEDLIRVSEARGRFIVESAYPELGTMAAIDASEQVVATAIESIEGAYLANLNAPAQTVISGTAEGVKNALDSLAGRGVTGKLIPVACAFHSKLVENAREPLRHALKQCSVSAPRIPVFSNTTAEEHGAEPEGICDLLADHLVSPVRFAEGILAMYEAGARVFIEAGPGKVLSGLAAKTLEGRPFVSVQMEQSGRDGLTQLAHALGQLSVAGVQFFGYRLFEGRVDYKLPLAKLLEETRPKPLGKTDWLIKHGRAEPAHQEPKSKPKSLAAAAGNGVPQVVSTRDLPARDARVSTQSTALDATPLKAAASARAAAPAAAMPTTLAGPSSNARDAVMDGHQQLMSKFLDMHRTVMLNYLGNTSRTAAPAVAPAAATMAAATIPEPAAIVPAPEIQMESPAPAVVLETPIVLNRESVTVAILNIVSERTGYPTEMLGLDLDLEAELGVDSIKRVEIFGALQTASMLPAGQIEMESLSKLKTLRLIVDAITAAPREELAGAAGLSATQQVQPSFEAHTDSQQLSRMVPRVVDAPNHGAGVDPEGIGTVLITDDGLGVAQALSGRLSGLGIASEIVAAIRPNALPQGRRSIGALVHLAPLGSVNANEAEEIEVELDRDLRSLFQLLKELSLQLSRGTVLAATAMGGTFAIDSDEVNYRPLSASVVGLMKTLQREWPEASVKTLDFAQGQPADKVAAVLVDELLTRGGAVEVGYSNGRRKTISAVPDSSASKSSLIELDQGSVVVITGGARGITAQTALELARHSQPTLVLIGRTPLGDPEPPKYARITDERKLKAAIAESLLALGAKPSPATVEAEWKRVRNNREIRNNLEELKNAGSRVEYHALDITDQEAFKKCLNDIYARLGRIDGVIHGAGVIEDKLLVDKTPESFDRVLRPKVVGAMTLLRAVRLDSLKFLIFYSSVSARYGNRGQCDYAAANEVLNKLAAKWNRKLAARVVSINWGPWESGGGMVTTELREKFLQAGVQLVSAAAGRRGFIQELFHERDGAEVVWGGPIPRPEARPLLSGRDGIHRESRVSFARTLETDPSRDLYLQDHTLDGTPVLPFAMAMEFLAESSCAAMPGMELVCLRELRVQQGITYPEDAPQTIDIEGEITGDSEREALIQASIKSRGRLHYAVQVELSAKPVAVPQAPRLELIGRRAASLSAREAYESWLFHGPLFEGIQDIEAMGDNGIIGVLRPSSPAMFLAGSPSADWLIDPLVIDSGLQLLIIWSRTYLDQTPLPARLGAFHRYGSFGEGPIRCEAEIHHTTGNPILRCQLRFFDSTGALAGVMQDMEVTCSKSLNRLEKSRAIAVEA